MIARDKSTYAELLKAISELSGLFSDNESPYIDSRFVERLFAQTTGGFDIGRADCSFDIRFETREGVGVKTFLAGAGDSKVEKIAEFNSLARQGEFNVSDKEELVHRIANARNTRVKSDAAEFDVDVSTSIYHCLVRFRRGACVHEEPYSLIDTGNLRPTRSNGAIASGWSDMGASIYFTDGLSSYSFNRSKSVLMKRFEFDRKREAVELSIHPRPLDLLMGKGAVKFATENLEVDVDSWIHKGARTDLVAGRDFVILPLYSTRTGQVPEASGINQWNASGRPRKFGEAYVPIPAVIHQLFPGFFPNRDSSFPLLLPNSREVRSAKVCQEGGKALMTDPNFHLGQWLIEVLDPTIPQEAFNVPVGTRRPFTMQDLGAVGKDSVRVTRLKTGDGFTYRAEFAPIGSYEDFVDVVENLDA